MFVIKNMQIGKPDDISDDVFKLILSDEEKMYDNIVEFFDGVKNDVLEYISGEFTELYTKVEKSIDPKLIDSIAKSLNIDSEKLANAMKPSTKSGFNNGAKDGATKIDYNIVFSSENNSALEALYKNQSKMSSKVTRAVSTLIKSEIINGIKGNEGIPDIVDRLLQIVNTPIKIVVPPKYDLDGNIVRNGYTRYVSPEYWAEMVARTEVNRAFLQGRYVAWKESGVVQTVTMQVSHDERTCSECILFDGEIFNLEESWNFLPLHPFCRCTFLPNVGDVSDKKDEDKIVVI